jgi:branched-chain amino acid transport system permease protein
MAGEYHPVRPARLPDPVVVSTQSLPASPLLERWKSLTAARRAQVVVGAVVLAYLIAAAVGGKHGYIHRKAPIGIVLVGVVYGSVTALGAMGLILVYRANRFINIAHGALGSMVGVLAIGMVKVHGLNFWIALPLAVAVGGAVGAITEITTIRRFSKSPRLVVMVASIGLAQAFGGLELLGTKHIGFESFTGAFAPPFNVSLKVDVYTFHSAEILIVAVVPVVIAFLAWFLLRTHVGVAVRAAAENEDRALLLGIPVRRLATIVWTIAGALAVLTYMLQAPIEGVKPGLASNGPSVLLPLLAAAVVARMESLPTAFAAGVGLGIMEMVVRWNTTGSPSFIWVVYLAVIVIALLAQSGKLSRAQESGGSSWAAIGVLKPIPQELRGLPEVKWVKRGLLLAVGVAFVVVPHTWGASNQLLAGFAMVWAMVAVSLVVLTGWSGNISLGQFGIAGVAAMLAGNMVARWNVDFFAVIAVSGAAGAAIALMVGLPALRIKGLFLAVTTLALAQALDQYFLNTNTFPQFIPANGVTRPYIWQRFNLNNNYDMYFTCLVFLGLAILVTMGMRKARAGRVLIATRDNERAAQSAAVPTTNVKLAGFAIAGIIAGVAGALDVFLLGALNPGSFPAVDSITVFAYSVIGGLGSVTGALIGVLLFKFLETVTAFGTYRLAISGAALLWVLSVVPGGLGQVLYSLRDRLLRMVADRRGILVPSLVADKRQAGGPDRSPDEEGLLVGALGGNGKQSSNGAEPTEPVKVLT